MDANVKSSFRRKNPEDVEGILLDMRATGCLRIVLLNVLGSFPADSSKVVTVARRMMHSC